jgi:hypothetical protein
MSDGHEWWYARDSLSGIPAVTPASGRTPTIDWVMRAEPGGAIGVNFCQGRGEARVPVWFGAGASGFVDGLASERVVGDARSD